MLVTENALLSYLVKILLYNYKLMVNPPLVSYHRAQLMLFTKDESLSSFSYIYFNIYDLLEEIYRVLCLCSLD